MKNSVINWISEMFAVKGVFRVRHTVLMGMLLAIAVVLDQATIYITPTFKAISFSYVPGVITAILFGPWAALAFGFASDTIKFIANSHGGAYFFGYALSEMTTYFIYACFLYKRPVRIWRVVVARLLYVVVVVFGLNFIWQTMMFGTMAGGYFTGVRLINNVVQFPFHVALTVCLGRYMFKIPFLNRISMQQK